MIQIGDTKLTKEQENIIVSALLCYEKLGFEERKLTVLRRIWNH